MDRILRVEPYMKLQGEQLFETENYVSSPPALVVLDAQGHVFTLGFTQMAGPRGEFAFDVLKDAEFTGEWASRIERRAGQIRIFTVTGWKTFNGRSFI